MTFEQDNVKPAPALQLTPAATGDASPDTCTRWRATTLGAVTEALDQRRVLERVGPVDGKRVLDLGSGDGLLTAALATHGALAVGVDIDRSMISCGDGPSRHHHARLTS